MSTQNLLKVLSIKVLSIGFICVLNNKTFLKVILKYPFFNVLEDEIESVITEVYAK